MASSATILSKKKKKKKEKKNYESRKKEVNTAKGSIGTTSADYVQTINALISCVSESLTGAVSGVTGVDTLVSQFDGRKEKEPDLDSYLAACSRCLDSEISDCDTRISELETEIDRLDTQYKAAKEREAQDRSSGSGRGF